MNNPIQTMWENWRKKRAGERREAECEPFLSHLSIELGHQPHFDQAFRAALTHSHGGWREELEKEWESYVKKGQPLEKGLASVSMRWNQKGIRRAMGLLIHLSTTGVTETGIQGINQLAKDLRFQQGIALKAYGNKLAVFSLLFIAVSALIPAFMLGFITVGSRFLELDITPSQIFLLTIIGFPTLDALVLGWGWIQTPAWMNASNHSRSFFQKWKKGLSFDTVSSEWKEWIDRMDFISKKNGVKNGFSGIVFSSVLEGSALFLIAWSAYLYYSPPSFFWMILLALAAISPFIIQGVWNEYRFARDTQWMERQCADALLGIAATPPTRGWVNTLESVVPSLENPLKGEWKKMIARMKRGMPVPQAIQKWGEGRNSVVLARVRRVLIQSYHGGHSLTQPGIQLAHELYETQSLQAERNATLLIEKYTILAAGGVLVPFLLGIITGVVGNLPFSSFTETNPGIFSAVQEGIPLYLFMYALLASTFVGFQEGNASRTGIYILVLVPLSQIAFLVGKMGMG